MRELEDAKDKVMMGAERRSMVMTEDEKKLTAYHEAGHALATVYSPASDPIHKATIIPRNNRRFMDRIRGRGIDSRQSVSGLMIGRELLFVLGHDH